MENRFNSMENTFQMGIERVDRVLRCEMELQMTKNAGESDYSCHFSDMLRATRDNAICFIFQDCHPKYP